MEYCRYHLVIPTISRETLSMQEKAGSDNNRTPVVFRVPDNPVIGRVAQGNHPQALTDRYVTVARHTAPASLPLESSRSQAYTNKTRFLPVSWLPIACCELTHPLRSNPITGSSILIQDDPPLFSALILSHLWDRHLRFSLNIGLITKHNDMVYFPEGVQRSQGQF